MRVILARQSQDQFRIGQPMRIQQTVEERSLSAASKARYRLLISRAIAVPDACPRSDTRSLHSPSTGALARLFKNVPGRGSAMEFTNR